MTEPRAIAPDFPAAPRPPILPPAVNGGGPAGASDDSLDRRLRRVETAVRAIAARVDLLLRRQRDPRIPALPDPPEAREFLPSYRPPQRD